MKPTLPTGHPPRLTWSDIKDKMAIIMIAINGLFLSWAVFFILNFFVQQILDDEKSQIVEESRNVILSGVDDVDSSLVSLVSFVSTFENLGIQNQATESALVAAIARNSPHFPFAGIFFIPENAADSEVLELYRHPTLSSSFEKEVLLNFIAQHKKDIGDDPKYYTLLTGKNYVFVRSVFSKDNQALIGRILAVVSFSDSSLLSGIQNIKKLRSIEIIDTASGATLYSFEDKKTVVNKDDEIRVYTDARLHATNLDLNIVFTRSLNFTSS